jgi:hypothetical protein
MDARKVDFGVHENLHSILIEDRDYLVSMDSPDPDGENVGRICIYAAEDRIVLDAQKGQNSDTLPRPLLSIEFGTVGILNAFAMSIIDLLKYNNALEEEEVPA